MFDHPTPEELEAFVWDRGPVGGSRKIADHIVCCDLCSAIVTPHLWAIFGQGEPPPRVLSPQEEAAYEGALNRAFTATVQLARKLPEKWKQEAIDLLANADPDDLPEIPPHLRGVPAIEALLELSSSLRHEDPERMLRLAELAWFYTEKAPLPEFDAVHRADFQCRVQIELGNAYRVTDNLSEAGYVLGGAALAFLNGTQNERLLARLLDVQASFYGDSRQFGIAGNALDFVFAAYMEQGDQHQAGRALLKRGIYLGYQGDAAGAVQLLQQGFELIDKERDPGLVFQALHNQARFLMDCGRPKDALIMIFDIRARNLDPGGRINELKVRWLEGQIFAASGDLDRATRALQSAKEGFEESDLPYKAALAGLELGAVLLRQGDREEARTEVLAAAEVFLALGVHREALVTVLLLKEKARLDQLDAALLDYVIRLLHRAEETEGEE